MKINKTILTTTLVIGAAATFLMAQEQRPPQSGRPQQRPEQGDQGRPGDGSRGGQGGRPSFPLVDALDANKDRTIDADEIAKASAALKQLDKNGDGKLTSDEYAPRFGGRGGPGGQGGGPGGPPPSGGGTNQGGRERPKSE